MRRTPLLNQIPIQALHSETGDRGTLACGWSPDGQRILSGSQDDTLKVWDAASGQCLLTLSGHSSAVWSCGWSPDGQRILSGSYDNTLKVWDAASGVCLATYISLPEGGWGSVDEPGARYLSVSPNAWRWLGWRKKQPDGSYRRLSLEALGPVPGLE